ncbi:TlpA family protein disulfide reductase [Kitasatospora sp. NPDC056076]|uniref:TlpA family protein disulfide reductase n=1 Tax=Kitasatospora sp. NPDC056076 TaxID=3345703 RepID=UPI0035E33448
MDVDPPPRRRRTAAAPAALTAALTAALLAGCSSGGEGAVFVTEKGTSIGRAAADGRRDAPEVTGQTLEGGPAALADHRGKVVVVNIWGSWCGPCRTEAPALERLRQHYQGQDVEFLGINTRDQDIANARRFQQEQGLTYPSLFDPAGTQLLRFPAGTLDAGSLPTTLVVDRRGRLAARALGGQSYDALESMVEPVLAEKSG